jgi:hypothetical protein
MTEQLLRFHEAMAALWSALGHLGSAPVEGWQDHEGVLRADLRPALFDLGEGAETDRLEAYRLFFPRAGVLRLAEALRAAPRARWVSWHRTIADVIARHELGPASRPLDVLRAATEDGLATRVEERVTILDVAAAPTVVARSTFRGVARGMIRGAPWASFAARSRPA